MIRAMFGSHHLADLLSMTLHQANGRLGQRLTAISLQKLLLKLSLTAMVEYGSDSILKEQQTAMEESHSQADSHT